MALRHHERSFRHIRPIIPLTSDTPRLRQHVSRYPVARRHANALPTKAAQIRVALRHHKRNFTTRSATHYKQTYHMRPPIIPLTSDTPRLRQRVSRSPVARRHANALPTKAAQVRMALRHRERRVATRSAHILAFRTRLPPKVTRQVSKTSVSYETSSKNSHVKTSVSYETSSKSQAETPVGVHTSRSPAKQFRDSSPYKQPPGTACKQ